MDRITEMLVAMACAWYLGERLLQLIETGLREHRETGQKWPHLDITDEEIECARRAKQS